MQHNIIFRQMEQLAGILKKWLGLQNTNSQINICNGRHYQALVSNTLIKNVFWRKFSQDTGKLSILLHENMGKISQTSLEAAS